MVRKGSPFDTWPWTGSQTQTLGLLQVAPRSLVSSLVKWWRLCLSHQVAAKINGAGDIKCWAPCRAQSWAGVSGCCYWWPW